MASYVNDGPGIGTLLLIAVAGFFAYEWLNGSQTQAVATTPATVPAATIPQLQPQLMITPPPPVLVPVQTPPQVGVAPNGSTLIMGTPPASGNLYNNTHIVAGHYTLA